MLLSCGNPCVHGCVCTHVHTHVEWSSPCAGLLLFCLSSPPLPLLWSVSGKLSPKRPHFPGSFAACPWSHSANKRHSWELEGRRREKLGHFSLCLCLGNTSRVTASLWLHLPQAARLPKGPVPAWLQALGSRNPPLQPGTPPALVVPAAADPGHLPDPWWGFCSVTTFVTGPLGGVPVAVTSLGYSHDWLAAAFFLSQLCQNTAELVVRGQGGRCLGLCPSIT